MMSSCIVVIPIYKDVPSKSECASIRQTFHILGTHDIVFITHSDCNLQRYEEIVSQEGYHVYAELFDKGYFDSTAHYSDLCFSEEFYLRFSKYEYMLICQTDAWVFRDELDYWCSKGYDYIGAPIYFPYNERKFTHVFFGIGNGGFCLRKIQHCLKVVNLPRDKKYIKSSCLMRMYWYYFLYNESFTRNVFVRLALIPKFILKCLGKGNTIGFFTENHINEDMLFGTWAAESHLLHNVMIPDEMTSARFSFELNGPLLLDKLDGKLPFGCHAFEKWNYEDFWKRYIDIEK